MDYILDRVHPKISTSGVVGEWETVKKIRIYKDKWIPRHTTVKPFSLPSLGDNATVDLLITPSSAWNVEFVKNVFCEEDTTAILSIPISKSRAKDSIQCHYDQKGFISNLSFSWWKSLWKLQIPSKIKLFLWKAYNNMLPTCEIFAQRNIPVVSLCPLCKSKNESALHGLWSCRFLKPMRAFWYSKLADFHKVHGSPSDKVVDVVDWAHFFIDEFHNASPAKSRSLERPTVRNPVWKPPDPED
ncbi:hypothetical protein Dsin_018390 [Dipteronia sinensis]|uniref:Reverse transcriptase zinc-binding domain-containing protein n=1 Tax=Dipteronia sinensis TaxID=43782 RepID=A0AAE0E328_9ROSI|nr:hypothetical protein Dsin_018390 [Dipteronia sinensis]